MRHAFRARASFCACVNVFVDGPVAGFSIGGITFPEPVGRLAGIERAGGWLGCP